jgi:hypothetical protein
MDVMQTTTNPATSQTVTDIERLLGRRSFATLATTSPQARAHVAGVIYAIADDALFISTMRPSRKARNIAANPTVAVTVPVRRIPVGPPSTVQFQSTAEILHADSPVLADLVERGELKKITGHGELELDDGCFLRIPLPRRLVTYGLGMSLRALIADPLDAGRIVERVG